MDDRVGPAGTSADFSSRIRDYGSVDAEARAARTAAALFDFSFMGRARLHGDRCVRLLDDFQSRPVAGLAPGRIAYSLRTDSGGAVRSDVTVWNPDGGGFEVFSGERRDIAELVAAAAGVAGVEAEDLSPVSAVYALQGPAAPRIMAALVGERLDRLPYFGCGRVTVGGVDCLVGRLGYTGEKGVELVAGDGAATLWRTLAPHARPAGFAAMDRLRIEAGFMLFSNECALPVGPGELGLARFARACHERRPLRLVCFRAAGRLDHEPWQPPRPCRIPARGEITVTSACRSELAGAVIGLGFVPAGDAAIGRPAFDPAAGFGRVTQISLPLYDPGKKRPRGPWRSGP